MKQIIDLTKHNFDRIDFTEANILDFHCPYDLPSCLEFNVWGATLLLDPSWKHIERFESTLSCDEDMYLAGNGIIRINNLVGGSIEVYVYDKASKLGTTEVAKYKDGSKLLLRREWPFMETENLYEYLWECVIQWPYGFCNLRLFSNNGKVSFQFNSDDMIPVNTYIANQSLYGFQDRNY